MRLCFQCWAWLIFLAILVVGCSDMIFGDRREIPAPVINKFPTELIGRAQGIYGGDVFQLYRHGVTHFIIIEGVDSPKPGQPFFNESRNALIQLVNMKLVRMHVIKNDSHKREIALVYVPSSELSLIDVASAESLDVEEVDVGLEIIRLGYGWYDGNEFESADEYRAAQAAARESKRGLWAEPDPIPPWDFKN